MKHNAVAGIGSALVDVLVRLEDDRLLEKFGLSRGSMTLVDAALSQTILDETADLERTLETGGSSANTIRAIAQLKGRTGFFGKIGDDEMGRFFRSAFERLAVSPHLLYSSTPTGKAATLISPDSERTFGTYLGAAGELTAAEIDPVMFSGYDYLHVEGYLVFKGELIEGVLKKAKAAGLKISLDLASYNVVEANLDFLHYLLCEYVDLVFANAEEARAYCGLDPLEAAGALASNCQIAVVKTGREGSLIWTGNTLIRIDTPQVHAVDTTGAGDVYAAGFLYGLACGFGLRQCGALGSLLASKVIQVHGARIPDADLPEILREKERLRRESE